MTSLQAAPCSLDKRLSCSARNGFTFVELLLVLTLFIVVLVASSDIFIRGQRSQSRSLALQSLQDEMRAHISRIANDVRTGSIDFLCYRTAAGHMGPCGAFIDPVGGNAILAIKDAQGASRWYKVESTIGDSACENAQSAPCIMVSDSRGAQWERLTARTIRINNSVSKFFISPDKNPFILTPENVYASNQQPRVLIRLEAEADSKGSAPVRLPLQTLISTREYKR